MKDCVAGMRRKDLIVAVRCCDIGHEVDREFWVRGVSEENK